jgi:large repetitive protein
VLTYVWSWGDGTANGTGVNATHVYTAAGTYTLLLTVTDGAGLTATAQTDVTATPLGCHITAASFKNPTSNTMSNFIELKNGGQADNGQFTFYATSNTACTSMGVSLPVSGGVYTTTLSFSDAGAVRNWTVTVTVGNSTKFVQANNQSGTFTGSGGATFPITFSAST